MVHLVEFQDEASFEARGRAHPRDGSHGILLRMYRNVPKADLKVLFPNGRPHMWTWDRMQVLLPLVFGLTTLGLRFSPEILGWLGVANTAAPRIG